MLQEGLVESGRDLAKLSEVAVHKGFRQGFPGLADRIVGLL